MGSSGCKLYLKCPAAVSVRHLKKFLRIKFELGSEKTIDIIYDDECLQESFSLMDVAYTFKWDRVSCFGVCKTRRLKNHCHKFLIKVILLSKKKTKKNSSYT